MFDIELFKGLHAHGRVNPFRHDLWRTAVTLLALAHVGVALAASNEAAFPKRPVRIVVPFPAGASPNDATARFIQPRLTELMRQQVIVDNRPGAAGIIGADLVAKANPDGHTILLTSTTLAIIPNANKNLPFDPAKDFAPISMLASAPQLVLVNPALPVSTLKELIAYARARPGQVKYGSAGNGTLPHLASELINHLAGVQMLQVPYKGGPPANAALISGEVQMFIATSSGALGHIKAGRVKVLAVAAKQRLTVLPDVPTMDEAGLPGFDVRVWYGIFAPAKTPPAIVQALYRHARAALDSPDVRARFAAADSEIVGSSPEEFTKDFHAELKRWAKFVSETGLKLD